MLPCPTITIIVIKLTGRSWMKTRRSANWRKKITLPWPNVSGRPVGSEGLGNGPPTVLRYYLDEHLPPTIAEQLRYRGIDAISAVEAGMAARAIIDEEQLAFAAT